MSGLDIKIENLTKSVHFDVIRNHCKDGGGLDWEVVLTGGTQKAWRNHFGVEIGATFSFCPYKKILIANCYIK